MEKNATKVYDPTVGTSNSTNILGLLDHIGIFSHPVSNYELWRLSFLVSNLERKQKNHTSFKLKVILFLNDHIGLSMWCYFILIFLNIFYHNLILE